MVIVTFDVVWSCAATKIATRWRIYCVYFFKLSSSKQTNQASLFRLIFGKTREIDENNQSNQSIHKKRGRNNNRASVKK